MRWGFGAVALSIGLLVASITSEAEAGKLMRFANWAARETVKVALEEYAKREAHENFDAFKQKFCGDQSYREIVLSSPMIKPLVADQSSAESLVMQAIGCGYKLGMINVQFIDAVPGNFEKGRATTCQIKAIALNYSKYHLNHLVLDIDGWKVVVGDMVANTYDDVSIPSFALEENGKCSNSANWLNQHVQAAAALECSIPNMAEGDCQGLVYASSAINVGKVVSLENQESDRESERLAAQVRMKAEQEARQRAEQARLEQQRKDDQPRAKAACVPGRMMRTTHFMMVNDPSDRSEAVGEVDPDTVVQVAKPSEFTLPANTRIPDDRCVVKVVWRGGIVIGTVYAGLLSPLEAGEANPALGTKKSRAVPSVQSSTANGAQPRAPRPKICLLDVDGKCVIGPY